MNEFPTLPVKAPLKLDSLYNYSASVLNSGDILDFSSLKYKIVLVVNISIDEPELDKEIHNLEKLAEKFTKDGLVVLVFPTNQFSQTNHSEKAIERKLEEVRTAGSSTGSMVVLSPVDVNGCKAHPLFRYLCRTIPMPADDPITFTINPEIITWQPVLRSDVAGNFEKFLILPNGRPYKRYSRNFVTGNLCLDVKMVMKTLANVRKVSRSGTKYVLTH